MSKEISAFFLIMLLYLPFWYFFNEYQTNRAAPILAPQSLPAPVLKIISMGNYEAAAQNLFYKTMFYNELLSEKAKTYQIDHKTTLRLLDIATRLDPYNMDCYYYGQATLADQPNFIRPLNTMLHRGNTYRTWDHYLPWFLGCNYYFGLHEKATAGKYFAEAARRKPDVSLYTTFAARSLHEGSETEMAVQVLQEMLLQTNSPVVAEPIKKRLQAFETVLFLRKALKQYHDIYKKDATTLNDLVRERILKAIPPDPYGGKFFLDKYRAVQTTSHFAMKPK